MGVVTMIHSPKVQLGLTTWYKNMLRKTSAKMPEGSFRNNSTGKMERCDGIVMLASGDMSPVSKGEVCSLIPLHYNYTNSYVSLLTGEVAGTIDCRSKSISLAINRYNEDLLNTIDSVGIVAYGRNIIVAYHVFDENWV